MGIIEFEKAFAQFASTVSKWAGSSAVFLIAALSILVWALSGPYFGFSAGWQMVVNTGTTICTFPYGVRHSEQSESGWFGASDQAG